MSVEGVESVSRQVNQSCMVRGRHGAASARGTASAGSASFAAGRGVSTQRPCGRQSIATDGISFATDARVPAPCDDRNALNEAGSSNPTAAHSSPFANSSGISNS
jgi:hypothetical protein